MKKPSTITMDYSDYLKLVEKKEITINLTKKQHKKFSFKSNEKKNLFLSDVMKNETIEKFTNFSKLSVEDKQLALSDISDYLGVCLHEDKVDLVHVSDVNSIKRNFNEKGLILEQEDVTKIEQWINSNVDFEEKSELNNQINSLKNQIISIKNNNKLLDEIRTHENRHSYDLIYLLNELVSKSDSLLSNMNFFQRILVKVFFRKTKTRIVEFKRDYLREKDRMYYEFKTLERNQYRVFFPNVLYGVTLFKDLPKLREFFDKN